MESPENRLKRLKMRAMRRGIREMDILLSRFADARLATLGAAELDQFEALLEENDQDLLAYVTRAQVCPPDLDNLIEMIRSA